MSTHDYPPKVESFDVILKKISDKINELEKQQNDLVSPAYKEIKDELITKKLEGEEKEKYFIEKQNEFDSTESGKKVLEISNEIKKLNELKTKIQERINKEEDNNKLKLELDRLNKEKEELTSKSSTAPSTGPASPSTPPIPTGLTVPGTAPTVKNLDAQKRINDKIDTLENEALNTKPAPKTPEEIRQEKIAKLRDDLSGNFSESRRKDLDDSLKAKLVDSRSKYVDAYKEKVKSKKNWFTTKINHWLGWEHRDSKIEGSGEEEVRIRKDLFDLEKGRVSVEGERLGWEIQQNLINTRVEKMRLEGKDESIIEAYKQRAEKAFLLYQAKKTGEVYDETQKEINAIWEAKKGWARRITEKAGNLIAHKPLLRHTIGNKWFRFGALTTTMMVAGSGISMAFIANRTIRFVGGSILGAKAGKMLGNKIWNEEKRISKRMKELEERYVNDKDTVNKEWQYNSDRRDLEKEINKLRRYRELLIIAMGASGSAIVGFGLSHVGSEQSSITDSAHEKAYNPKEITDTTLKQSSELENLRKNSIKIDTNQSKIINIATTPPHDYEVIRAHSGHGVEHSLRASIEHNHVLAEKLKDILNYKGEISSTEDLRKFSGVAAHQIAIQEGYVSADGSERWVHGNNDVAYQMRIEGGEIIIDEKVLENGHWVAHDQVDSVNDTFETDTDKSTDGHVYEKTHSPYKPISDNDIEKIKDIKRAILETETAPHDSTPRESLGTGSLTDDTPRARLEDEEYELSNKNTKPLEEFDAPPNNLEEFDAPNNTGKPPEQGKPIGSDGDPRAPRRYNPSISKPGPLPQERIISNLTSYAEDPNPVRQKGILEIILEPIIGKM